MVKAQIYQAEGGRGVMTLINFKKEENGAMTYDRRITVVVFALFFSWLLAFPFEGQILHAIADYRGVSAQSFVFGAMAAHIAGLISCGFFVRNMPAAKKLILVSIAFCAVATGVFFFPPSFMWMVALLLAAFLVGCCVAAWGFYFKGCTSKDDRIKTMADGLIFSNILMILLNMSAIHISPQFGLGFSILMLVLALIAATRLPRTETVQEQTDESAVNSDAVKVSMGSALAFLCLFIVVITINSGLMYRVVNPAFAHLEILTSWYWAVPYIAALYIMRNLSGKKNRAHILYVAIAMIGLSFVLFMIPGRSWPNYLVVNTLLLGACGVYDLFWWSILGDMLELHKNPARIIGIGLSANVAGVLLGEIIGNAINASGSELNHLLLAFGVVCVTLLMLPFLNNRLAKLLKNHIYLTSLTAFAEITIQKQPKLIDKLNITEELTEQEHAVMLLLIQGKTYKAIADELFITPSTVNFHAGNIYSKAGVAGKTELANLVLNKLISDLKS